MAMLEAMAMNVPVVSSRIGGAEEAIENGVTGYIFDPGNVNQLASRLNVVLADIKARKRMGDRARATVESQFSQSRMIARSTELLSRIELAQVRLVVRQY